MKVWLLLVLCEIQAHITEGLPSRGLDANAFKNVLCEAVFQPKQTNMRTPPKEATHQHHKFSTAADISPTKKITAENKRQQKQQHYSTHTHTNTLTARTYTQ